MSKPESMNGGVTLAEILVALTVIAITALALVALQTSILKGRQKSAVNVHAAKLAGTIMLEVESRLAADIEIDVSQARVAVPPTLLPDNPYEFEYEVSQSFDGLPERGLKDIGVTVYWKDKNGAQKRSVWSKFTQS